MAQFWQFWLLLTAYCQQKSHIQCHLKAQKLDMNLRRRFFPPLRSFHLKKNMVNSLTLPLDAKNYPRHSHQSHHGISFHFLCTFYVVFSIQFLLERCIVQVSFNAQTRKDVRHRHSFNTGILIQSTHHFQPNLKLKKRYVVTWKTAGSKTGRSRQLRVPGEIIFNLIVLIVQRN